MEAKVLKWKGGATPNLRALIAGLDGVLWESAGWKKVGLADLVVNSRVKVNYMKAIAKVHPDKVCFLVLLLFFLVFCLLEVE